MIVAHLLLQSVAGRTSKRLPYTESSDFTTAFPPWAFISVCKLVISKLRIPGKNTLPQESSVRDPTMGRIVRRNSAMIVIIVRRVDRKILACPSVSCAQCPAALRHLHWLLQADDAAVCTPQATLQPYPIPTSRAFATCREEWRVCYVSRQRTNDATRTHLASCSARLYESIPLAPYSAPDCSYTTPHPARSMSRDTERPVKSEPGSIRGGRWAFETFQKPDKIRARFASLRWR
jgi:hypothetical protein